MNDPAQKLDFQTQDYLAWEAEQPLRNEYVNGEVFAMTGGSDAHNTVSLNLAIALKPKLRGGACRVYMLDMKLWVEQANAYFYPDLMVTCEPGDQVEPYAKSQAVFVAEVLSPSTEAFDRGEKFAHYRKLPSLREYLLIDPRQQGVELFRLDENGHWVLYPHVAGQTLELTSLSLEISVSELFEDLLPAGQPQAPAL